ARSSQSKNDIVIRVPRTMARLEQDNGRQFWRKHFAQALADVARIEPVAYFPQLNQTHRLLVCNGGGSHMLRKKTDRPQVLAIRCDNESGSHASREGQVVTAAQARAQRG